MDEAVRCNRYVFEYVTGAEEVREYLLRLADFAEKVYGRDTYFSRFNQMLDMARALGWNIPKFPGGEIPDVFKEVSPEGIDHILENQAKILIDVAPQAQVVLESEKRVPIKMIPSTTPAGDLVWKSHLLVDENGRPYLERKKRHLVKAKGTQILVTPETTNYDEEELASSFGLAWPVPFLPEFFSNHSLAEVFAPEAGVIELVKIEERVPVHVLANKLVPWYQTLEVDRTRALPLFIEEEDRVDEAISVPLESSEDYYEPSGSIEIEDDSESWLEQDEDIEEEGDEEEDVFTDPLHITNVFINLTDSEKTKLAEIEAAMIQSGITSKEQARKLQEDPKEKKRAEDWLLAGVNRLTLLANASNRLGAALSLIQRHSHEPLVLIQPRDKWAKKLFDLISQRGFTVQLLEKTKNKSEIKSNKTKLQNFIQGKSQVLVTTSFPGEELPEQTVVISVASFSDISWIESLNSSHLAYFVVVEDLGFADINMISDYPGSKIRNEQYDGPPLELFKWDKLPLPKDPKPKAEKKKSPPKFQVKAGKGRASKAATYEKALEIVKKKEAENLKCEILSPENQVIYITGVGEIK